MLEPMSAPPRTYTLEDDDLLPDPDPVDLAAGIVSPLDVPVGKPIPLLRLKSRHFRKERARLKAYRSRLLREGHGQFMSREERQLRKLKRSRSSMSLPVTSDLTLVKKARRLQDLDEDFHVKRNLCKLCFCEACMHQRAWSGRLQQYRCTNRHCRILFESFQDMYEHQLDVHGGIDPRANRVVADLFHQQQGHLAFPPATVYAGQQYMIPSRPPTPWKSMDELDEEAKTLKERLWDFNRYYYALPLNLFKMAYKLVKRNGVSEMERQYHIAMEHFHSAYKFPAASRGFHDGCPSVERNRNWLTSTEREDVRLFHPFSLNDKVEVEPEFVLIDTKRDQELLIELSDDSDDEDAPTNGKPASEKKVIKVDDDDVEMNDAAENVKEWKVFDADDASDATVKSEAEDSATNSDGSDDEMDVKSGDEDEDEAKAEAEDGDDEMDARSEAEDSDSDSDSDDEIIAKSEAEDCDDEMDVKSDDEDSDSDGNDEMTAKSEVEDSDTASKSSESDDDNAASDSEVEGEENEEDGPPSTIKVSASEAGSSSSSDAKSNASSSSASDGSSDEEEQNEIFNQLE